jgi:hypothetical protein
MKTFKDIINEVAEPKGGDEKRFKAKHVVAKYDHPIEDGAEENQFKGGTKKDKSKKASYEDGKDEEVYEGYASDAQRKAVHASKDEQKKKKTYKEMFSGQDLAEDPWEEVPMMARQMEFICEAAEDIKEYVMSGVDPEEWFQNKVAHVHGQMQGLYAYVEGDERMKSAKMADMNPMGEEVELDEAFKMGSMKLKDGSTVKLSKEEAEAVNELFSELNSSNKKRMEEEMMKDKSGFDKVLKFAKEAM